VLRNALDHRVAVITTILRDCRGDSPEAVPVGAPSVDDLCARCRMKCTNAAVRGSTVDKIAAQACRRRPDLEVAESISLLY